MNKVSLLFDAQDQTLKVVEVPRLAQEIVSYVDATFTLGSNWEGFDSIRAVWTDGTNKIATVLNDGYCIVPPEVLSQRGVVKVNLVGSVVKNDVLSERLTTEQIIAVVVKKEALIEGSETDPITPSQFEQYVSQIQDIRDEAYEWTQEILNAENKAEEYADAAKDYHDETKTWHDEVETWHTETQGYADSASADADRAEQAANESGYMFFEINSDGHLIYFRTASVDVDFYLNNGHLYLEEVTNGN